MLNNFGLCSGHFVYCNYLDPIYILGRLFIFLFKGWLTLLQVLTCLLWSVFLTSVQFSKPLQCHLDLFSMCVIHCPVWDLGSDLFQRANLKTVGLLFRIRSTMSNSEVSPKVNMPLCGIPLLSSHLSVISLFLILWGLLLLSPARNLGLWSLCSAAYFLWLSDPSIGSPERKRSNRDSSSYSWNYSSSF